jgi:acetyl-CoA synthetase
MTRPLFGAGEATAWQPSQEQIARSRLTRLIARVGAGDIEGLHRRAVDDPDWYWRTAVDDLGIEFSTPFSAVVDITDGKEFPRWFVDGRLNLASNCVDRWATGAAAAKIAVIWEDESGRTREMTYGELYEESAALGAYLRSVGVGAGDRVGLFLPMICETAVAFMACARIGAIAVPAFTGYGPKALQTRLDACDASALITADGFIRRGSVVPMKATVDAALTDSAHVQRVVVVPHIGADVPLDPSRDVLWPDALACGRAKPDPGASEQVDSNHPFLLVYTSGTTGAPKGIVHSHGGFLAKVGADFGYSFDVQEDDVLLWNTDPGWLVGPLVTVATLMFHATAVFYEGSPDRPDLGRLWSLVDRYDVTVVGIAPSMARSMQNEGDALVEPHDRSSLRAFVSTGEAWSPEPWRWVFETVGGGRLPILNYSGGTEIGGGILTCYPITPIAPGGFSGPVIGLDADVVDPTGATIVGDTGELVIRNIAPGMTHGFWQDRERYLSTYWSEWPGVWLHGDVALHAEDGYWYIRGRSDDTIKVSGKRVGPAEIESVLGSHPAVAEAIAVGVPDERTGNAVICFVVRTAEGMHEDEGELCAALTQLVVSQLDKTIRPRTVHFVDELPKTRTGKLMRRVARARYLGEHQGDLSSMESMSALEALPRLDAGPA